MHCHKEISPSIYWVGGNDYRLALFENMFPLTKGVSYNSYLILDDCTALLDTVDSAISGQYMENIDGLLAGRTLDYLIINHMEPDHGSQIGELVRRYPDVKLVGNKVTFQYMEQFFAFSKPENYVIVKEGDELSLGRRTLRFYTTPLVHWPEVMVTYEPEAKILFSADAFGCFGALNGNIFSDETDFEHVYLEDARRYYANIVGKFGPQVQKALAKLSSLDIRMICPLHGPIWRSNLSYILEKYQTWSSYKPEKTGVMLAYGSMYGNTENVMSLIANKLAAKGVKDIRMYDISKTHPSYIISDIWKFSHLVLGAPTYNMGLYYGMHTLLHEMASLNVQNHKVALVGNYTWASAAVREMSELLGAMKKVEVIGEPFEIKSTMKTEQMPRLDQLVKEIVLSMEACAV